MIFICTFDPYGKGLPVYHFTNRSREDDSLEMDLRIVQDEAREARKKEGMAHGKQEGERKKALEIAEALRKKGMSETKIEELTGVSEKKETLK